MAAKGYTTHTLVAAELGRTFTSGQNSECDGLIEEAEAYIDNETGRAWLVASPVVDEPHLLTAPFVYLDNVPVSSITSVKIRSTAIGAAETTLVAGSGYELIDGDRGLLNLSSYPLADPIYGGPVFGNPLDDRGPSLLVKVSYAFTNPTPLPMDLQRAATMLVAAWMLPRLDPASASMSSVSVGQNDVAVQYRDVNGRDVPPMVNTLLSNFRRLIFA